MAVPQLPIFLGPRAPARGAAAALADPALPGARHGAAPPRAPRRHET